MPHHTGPSVQLHDYSQNPSGVAEYPESHLPSMPSTLTDKPSLRMWPDQHSGYQYSDAFPYGSDQTADRPQTQSSQYSTTPSEFQAQSQPPQFSGLSSGLPSDIPRQDAAGQKVPFPQDSSWNVPLWHDTSERLPLQQVISGKPPFQQDTSGKVPSQQDTPGKVPFSQDSSWKVPLPQDSSRKVPLPQNWKVLLPQDTPGKVPLSQDSSGSYHPQNSVPFGQQEESPHVIEEVELKLDEVNLSESAAKPFDVSALGLESQDPKAPNGVLGHEGSQTIPPERPRDDLATNTSFGEHSTIPGSQEKVPVERCISTDFHDAGLQCVHQKCPIEMNYNTIKRYFHHGAKELGKGGFGVVYEGKSS